LRLRRLRRLRLRRLRFGSMAERWPRQ
jgi:hypothetical protein